MQFRSEFKRIAGLADDVSIQSLMESWDLWQNRIIAYSMLESGNSKKLKDLIRELDVSSDLMKGVLQETYDWCLSPRLSWLKHCNYGASLMYVHY